MPPVTVIDEVSKSALASLSKMRMIACSSAWSEAESESMVTVGAVVSSSMAPVLLLLVLVLPARSV